MATAGAVPDLVYHGAWPRCERPVPRDEATEAAVAALISQMTLDEKIGQMIQPELFQVTPEEAARFKFGSVLNGAGLFPNGNKHAGQAEWVATVDAFWGAVNDAYADRPFRIPLMWATDAVHGHNNLFGATIFPHNIGLGCASDPALIGKIGAATAREVAATGIDWTFAPNVATPRDYRWGRHFEGYSEAPAVVAAYAAAMVSGLQGDRDGNIAANGVIACAKHWIADGGTERGVDRGDAHCSDDILRNIHAAGYFASVAAGVNAVMVSFSGWANPLNYDHSPDLPGAYNGKLSGSRYLINDVLKERMGFDGLVITDWDAHADVSRCDFGEAAFVLNAGVDILMVSPRRAWMGLIQSTRDHVAAGRIPMARIDDAVTRILRVKMRARLWDKPRPRDRPIANDPNVIGAPSHRALARHAVQRSAVLLKNNRQTLPLSRTGRVLVTGSAAADIQKQTGGWTLSWQGTDVGPSDLPGCTTISDGVARIVGGERTVVDPALTFADPAAFETVIAVIGEDAYAEMRGNIRPWRSLSYAHLKTSYHRDLEILRQVRKSISEAAASTRVVTIFFGGRPLYLSEEINLSDSFIAAWLPGPEGDALAEMIFEPQAGHSQVDFTGRLSFSWPRERKSFVVNHRPAHIAGEIEADGEDGFDAEHRALFPFGYGLSYAMPALDLAAVGLDEPTGSGPIAPATRGLDILKSGDTGFDWTVCGHNIWATQRLDLDHGVDLLIMRVLPATQDAPALDVEFKGYAALLYARYADKLPHDFRPYLSAGARIAIDLTVISPPDGPVYLALHDDYPSQVGHDLAPALAAAGALPTTIRVPFAALDAIGMELENVDTAFMLYSEAKVHLRIDAIRIELPNGEPSDRQSP